METRAGIGLMGKHPGYGDFLRSGLSDRTVDALNGWLDATLPPLRDGMGEGWGAFWDAAQDLRFWIGPDVIGQTLVGVLHPSRDRVGRRFPLLLLAEAADVPLPIGTAADQAAWDRLAAHLEEMTPGQGSAALLAGLDLDLPREDAAGGPGPVIWAHHPEGDLAALLASAEAPDAARARRMRSYWWAPGRRDRAGDRAACWLACPGLPEAQSLAWLLAGVPAGEDGE